MARPNSDLPKLLGSSWGPSNSLVTLGGAVQTGHIVIIIGEVRSVLSCMQAWDWERRLGQMLSTAHHSLSQ
eukprot:scaffold183800_cov22-Tisochrysis_lutea.AAC.1